MLARWLLDIRLSITIATTSFFGTFVAFQVTWLHPEELAHKTKAQ